MTDGILGCFESAGLMDGHVFIAGGAVLGCLVQPASKRQNLRSTQASQLKVERDKHQTELDEVLQRLRQLPEHILAANAAGRSQGEECAQAYMRISMQLYTARPLECPFSARVLASLPSVGAHAYVHVHPFTRMCSWREGEQSCATSWLA